jgi:hypothetical protein
MSITDGWSIVYSCLTAPQQVFPAAKSKYKMAAANVPRTMGGQKQSGKIRGKVSKRPIPGHVPARGEV